MKARKYKVDRRPDPQEVKRVREACGLTQQKTADIFGYALRSWQHKEESGNGARALTIGEWQFLLLLAGLHPFYLLESKSN